MILDSEKSFVQIQSSSFIYHGNFSLSNVSFPLFVQLMQVNLKNMSLKIEQK